jgi:UDP-glucuronate 4-epimerase
MRRAFITGTSGFIGFHLARLMLDMGWQVHGFDGMTSYYDIALKRARITTGRWGEFFDGADISVESSNSAE